MKALAILLALAPLAAAAPAVQGPVYRITGTAVSARDGSPIPFCRLHLAPMTPGAVRPVVQRQGTRGVFQDEFRGGRRSPAAPENDSVTADAHGHFSIDVPAAGGWDLTGIARGFHSQPYDGHEGYSSAIVLTPAAPAAAVKFRLQPDATVLGTVFDEAGEPVADAQVVAQEAVGQVPGNGSAFGLTDDRGHYELTGLAAGAYKIRVQGRPWYTGAGANFPRQGGARLIGGNNAQPSPLDPSLDVVYPIAWFGGGDEHTAGVVRLAGGEVRQADFNLQPVASAHLVVPREDAAGQGQAGERGWTGPVVTRLSTDGFNGPTGTMRNNATGAWDVGGLAPGTYQVRMPGPPGEQTADVRQFTIAPGATGPVDLSAALRLLDVTLTFDGADPAATNVVFTSLVDGSQYLAGERGRGRGRNRDDDDAEAQRTIALPPGSYSVSIAQGSEVFLTSLSATGAEVSGMTVRVLEGSPAIRLQLAEGRADLGGVVTTGTKPQPGAMVLLVPASSAGGFDDAAIARDQSNTDGSYNLHAIVPGRYILVALDHGWDVKWRDPATLAQYLLHGKPVELKAHGHAELDIEATQP